MSQALHAWAIAPAALGACCVAVDRNARFLNLASSLLMVMAMLDAWLTHALAPIVWSSVMIATAVLLSVLRRRRSGDARRRAVVPVSSHEGDMSLYATLGMVIMAGLLLMMNSAAPVGPSTATHVHGNLGDLLVGTLLIGTGGYAVYGVLCAVWARSWLRRVQFSTMSVSILTTAIALLL